VDLPAPAAENRGMAFRFLVLAAALAASAAGAQQATAVGSESRDTATLSVGASNFAVGRVARECLGLVGRSESPEQFITQWRQRNARFVSASSRYIERRLEEAAASGGPDKREALLRDIRNAVQGSGDSLARSLLQRGRKEEACMNAVTLVDTGVLDITPKLPTYSDIESLVRWAEQ
jgi:hypothetical protein